MSSRETAKGTPTRRTGAPRNASVPQLETVRVTAPDLQRRAALEKTRGRLVLAAGGFALLFGAVCLKLADATIIHPVEPRQVGEVRPSDLSSPPDDPAHPGAIAASDSLDDFQMPHARRAMITDRNGEILAISLPTAALYANPREMTDAADAAHKLKLVLPTLDETEARARLSQTGKQFVYLAREITPRQELAVNQLGIPGIYFEATERRHYPLGRVAAQVLGGVDVDEHGVAGVERYFERRMMTESSPLRLSIDVRVQAVVRDELSKAMNEFHAIGACGIVMDVRTAEVIAMVSLPDYDANDFGKTAPDDRFNRAVTGMYEPGSTFKLQTASMALDDGVVNLNNGFDATAPIHIGRFTINDFEGKHRFLYVPEIIAYSSNIGAAKMAAAVGAERQRAWLQKLGLMSKLKVELPEAGQPLFPPVANWKEVATYTIGFGHGVAVSPLHVVMATAAVSNGGILHQPTLIAQDDDAVRDGTRIMQQKTSDTVRKLMRLVVTDGYGKNADVPGYFVGGKTGTAEKVSHRGYNHNSRVSAFMSAFPMNAPRYAVYMMLDEPKADASTHGFATAGWVSAPAAGRVIARAAPMLGLLPQIANADAIQATLALSLTPGGKPSPFHLAPVPKPVPPVASAPQPPAGAVPAVRDMRHEAAFVAPNRATE